MRGEAGEGRGGGGEDNRGGSQATCTRQQPPTSEELIINLLSPSLECRSNSTTFGFTFTCVSLSFSTLARFSPAVRPVHSHSHPSSSPRGSSPPFPFLPDSPHRLSPRISERHRFHSFLLRPPTLRRRGRLRLRLLALTFAAFPSRSRLRFRPSYRPPNLVATFRSIHP